MLYPAFDLAAGFAALLIICLLGGYAAAQGMGSAMSEAVQIQLRGHIVPRCDLNGAASSLNLGTLPQNGAQGQQQLQFQVSCNTPFAYQLSSANGAMRHESAPVSGSGSTDEFSYRAALAIPTDSAGILSLDCPSSQLAGAPGACSGVSGQETAIGKDASLTVSWGPVAGPLATGQYTDDIQIALSVQQ